MLWRRGARSADIEDRRGESAGGGLGPRLPGGGAGLCLGGVLIPLVLSLLFGQNFFAGLEEPSGPPVPMPAPGSQPPARPADQEELVGFVSFVLDDVQDMWTREFQRQG